MRRIAYPFFMIKRDLEPSLLQMASEYPVVTLLGPRQSGKTTLVQAAFPHYAYCNLENPENRAVAEKDPKAFFQMFPQPMIIDEVQRVPELLSWIQVLSDENGQHGQFILTGSHQLRLHEAITQSLAGRTAILRLLPLSLHELTRHEGSPMTKAEYMVKGFLPRIYDRHQTPSDAYRNYFQTYIERDVRQLINLRNLNQFELFMKLLAGRVGQMLNLSQLSNEVGVSSTTLKEWVSILEASFILYRLPPYYRNFGKRLVKTPKIFFIETGLAAWLLGIETPQQAMRDPLHGNLFENMVVMEALKARMHLGKDPSLYFWRDGKDHEIDLILDRQRHLIPIEVKSSMTWHDNFANNIRWFRKTLPDVRPGYVLYAGDLTLQSTDFQAHHYTSCHKLLSQ